MEAKVKRGKIIGILQKNILDYAGIELSVRDTWLILKIVLLSIIDILKISENKSLTLRRIGKFFIIKSKRTNKKVLRFKASRYINNSIHENRDVFDILHKEAFSTNNLKNSKISIDDLDSIDDLIENLEKED